MSIKLKGVLAEVLNLFGNAWWIEISTTLPNATYYFGPFLNCLEAESSADGCREELRSCIEDLTEKAVPSFHLDIKRCKPAILTIGGEAAESSNRSSRAATDGDENLIGLL
jgi:Domain of unknown function (DUF1816)